MLIHQPVLLTEVLNGLAIKPTGIYIDGTFGRGGHSSAILEKLSAEGHLLAIDKDMAAVEVAKARFGNDHRFAIEHGSFADLSRFVEQRGWQGKVDGIFFDLGVSSPQLDNPERGFSFMRDGPLDMRMDTTQGMSAAQWVNSAPEKEIADVLFQYGEEKFSRRIARSIVNERQQKPVLTTAHLAKIVADANPAWEREKHPATRSFQAIRIFINNELSDLTSGLEQAIQSLAPGGRLLVISFHSLEDRIVKRFMREQAKGDNFPVWVPVKREQLKPTLRLIGKAIKPSPNELTENARARSAVLRIGEKLL